MNTMLHLSLNQVKYNQVPFCKFNTHNWHKIQFGQIKKIIQDPGDLGLKAIRLSSFVPLCWTPMDPFEPIRTY